jgi:hypothetical protein
MKVLVSAATKHGATSVFEPLTPSLRGSRGVCGWLRSVTFTAENRPSSAVSLPGPLRLVPVGVLPICCHPCALAAPPRVGPLWRVAAIGEHRPPRALISVRSLHSVHLWSRQSAVSVVGLASRQPREDVPYLVERRHPFGSDSRAFMSVATSSAVGQAPGGVVSRLATPPPSPCPPAGWPSPYSPSRHPPCQDRESGPAKGRSCRPQAGATNWGGIASPAPPLLGS